jgi:hypothetical protein
MHNPPQSMCVAVLEWIEALIGCMRIHFNSNVLEWILMELSLILF